jgi:mRNA interferase MazF
MAGMPRWSPDRRDVIWINFSPQTGREMREMHPLLVLSPKAFNERTGIVIGLPMTRSGSNATNPFAIHFSGKTGIDSYILTCQPKSFDWKLRGARQHPMKQVPLDIFEQACDVLNQIIQLRD